MKEILFSSFYQAYQKGDLHVLDVREQEEYDALHLDGVRLLPLSELADRYQELEKDQSYYVICKSGRRSARACQFLEEQGYDVPTSKVAWMHLNLNQTTSEKRRFLLVFKNKENLYVFQKIMQGFSSLSLKMA